MAQVPAQTPASSEQTEPKQHPVTARAIVLGTACVTFMAWGGHYTRNIGHTTKMAQGHLPWGVMVPFIIITVILNKLLQKIRPQAILTRSELLVIFAMASIGSALPSYFMAHLLANIAAPYYFPTPENGWATELYPHLASWTVVTDLTAVRWFYEGLPAGASIPWGAWMTPLFWRLSLVAAIGCFCYCVVAILRKQWVEHERLTFPLAEVSMELTEGFDLRPGWAPFVCNRLFWVGFAIAALPILWNLIEYWVPDFPRLTIFDPRNRGRTAPISRYLPWPFSYRLLPTLMGFTFLCDLNILFSIWSLYLVGLVTRYWMTRVGVSIGLTGQEAKTGEILGLFGHGVMIGLVIWTIWTAREHLMHIFRQILHPPKAEAERTIILSPRGAAVAILGGSLYMVFWLYAAGYSLTMAAVWMLLLWTSILAVMKFLAASGFAYMFPNWGTAIPRIWIGTSQMTESTLITMRVINSRLLPGWRLPAVLPYLERLIGAGRRVGWLVFGCVILGVLSAALYTIGLCYEYGGTTFRTWSLVGAPVGMYNGIAKVVTETSQRTVPDPSKILAWTTGGLVATLFTFLQSRFTWWPLHPLGLFLMFSGYVRLYVLDIFLVWLAKLVVLQFGGILLYRRLRPCCYGLIVGYLFAVGCSFIVDFIWFPEGGHYIHGY